MAYVLRCIEGAPLAFGAAKDDLVRIDKRRGERWNEQWYIERATHTTESKAEWLHDAGTPVVDLGTHVSCQRVCTHGSQCCYKGH